MVVAPLEQELAGLRRALRPTRWGVQRQPLSVPLEMHVVGVGQAAAQRVSQLLAAWRPRPAPLRHRLDGLVLLGFAGALSDAVGTGDLILSSRYYREGLRDFAQPDLRMWRDAVEAMRQSNQRMSQLDSVTVARLVTAPEERCSLAHQYGAATVNMEDYWLARAAAEAGVPFLSARAVLDNSTQRLPAYLPDLVGSSSRAALALACKPWRVPAALRIARQSQIASATLVRFALAFERHLSSLAPLSQRGVGGISARIN